MAKYAYRDKDRKHIIYSDEAIEEDRNTAFFCPNHMCNAKLYICAVNGSKSAYFRATKSDFKHIKNCPFGNSSTEFDSNKYDESKFVYEDAINNLLCNTKLSSKKTLSSAHGTGEPSAHPPKTLRQIYSLCKSFPVGKKKEGYLVSPINSKKYTFILSFLDEDNYKKIRSEIYNNRDKIIVIAGEWESSGEYNKFTSKVYGKKQVAIIKSRSVNK